MVTFFFLSEYSQENKEDASSVLYLLPDSKPIPCPKGFAFNFIILNAFYLK